MVDLPVLGIDVAKRSFVVALIHSGKTKNKTCENSPAGYTELMRWLLKQGVERVHACMEATGAWSEAVATALADEGHVVSIVNPLRIKGFAQSELNRTKTDKVDAGLIARFCAALRPEPWTAPSPVFRELQALIRRLADLKEMQQMETNRLKSGVTSENVKASLRTLIAALDDEIEETKRLIKQHVDDDPDLKGQVKLLATIPGIGEHTASVLLGEIGDLLAYESAKQLAAYCGLNPRERQSGTSVRGRTAISKVGNARLRRQLYMPALSAMRSNPILKAFAERLKARGKNGKAVVVAIMRKLVHLAYGILKHRAPFDARYLATT